MELGSVISLLGPAADVAGIYSWITGIKYGKSLDEVLNRIRDIQESINRNQVETLSNHIFLNDSIQEVKDITRTTQKQLNDRQQIKKLLEPVQRRLNCDIISTSIIPTPHKIAQKSLDDYFYMISPLDRIVKPPDPTSIPFLFERNQKYFIGWQKRALIPFLFDCEYEPQSKLYLPPRSIDQDEVEVKKMLKEKKLFDRRWNTSGVGLQHQYEIIERCEEKVVIDSSTKLIWQHSGSVEPIPFSVANAYIYELNKNHFAGYENWRLPTLEEAVSLLKPKWIEGALFVDSVFDERQVFVWTAKNCNGGYVWVVSFRQGYCYKIKKFENTFVRAVCTRQVRMKTRASAWHCIEDYEEYYHKDNDYEEGYDAHNNYDH